MESHFVDSLIINFYFEPFRKSVRNRRAYAVQTARETIVFIVELAAGVKLREYYLNAGNARLLMNIRGYTSSVIFNGNAPVFIKNNLHFIGKTVCRFVDRIVDYLP